MRPKHVLLVLGLSAALPQRMMRAWVRRDGTWKLAATITTTVWPQKAQ